MPVSHYSVFYRPDALPAAQPTASKHWRHMLYIKLYNRKQWTVYLKLPVNRCCLFKQSRNWNALLTVFYYPSIRSMGGILSLLFLLFFCCHGFLCWDFTDRCEIWQEASPTSQADLLKFWRWCFHRQWTCGPEHHTRSTFQGQKMANKLWIERKLCFLAFRSNQVS